MLFEFLFCMPILLQSLILCVYYLRAWWDLLPGKLAVKTEDLSFCDLCFHPKLSPFKHFLQLRDMFSSFFPRRKLHIISFCSNLWNSLSPPFGVAREGGEDPCFVWRFYSPSPCFPCVTKALNSNLLSSSLLETKKFLLMRAKCHIQIEIN